MWAQRDHTATERRSVTRCCKISNLQCQRSAAEMRRKRYMTGLSRGATQSSGAETQDKLSKDFVALSIQPASAAPYADSGRMREYQMTYPVLTIISE
jgi:hypothetical protein